MKSYHYRVFAIFAFLGVVLVQYQNCGSSPGAGYSENQELFPSPSNDDVGVINEINTGDIHFLQSKTEVRTSDSQVRAFGTCSELQRRASLSWKLVDQNEQLLFEGQSICQNGSFEVAFEGAENLSCNAELKLHAYFGAKAETSTLIQKICN